MKRLRLLMMVVISLSSPVFVEVAKVNAEIIKNKEMKVSRKFLYQPHFYWKDNKIYDNDKEIASFVADSYMGPILHNVVLKPGGKPLVNWAIGWRAQFISSTYKIDKICAKGQGSSNLEMEFISHSPNKYFSSKVHIVLTYDPELKSYVYNTKASLTVNKFPFTDWCDFCQKCSTQWYPVVPKEFANINPLNKVMWQSWIYKDVEGNWIKIPLTHLWLPGYTIQFNRKEGIIGLFNSQEGNVVIELLDNTPENSQGSLCWAGYDIHFKCKLNMYARKYWAKYRILCYDYDSDFSKNVVSRAQLQTYSPEELEVYGLPSFEVGKVNDFTKGIDITTNDQGAFWIPFGDVGYSKWLKSGGYNGKGCIKTESKTPISVNWQIIYFFAPTGIIGKEYIFSAYVKTENLEGEGAYLSCKIGGKEYISPELTGDNDWTKICVIIPTFSRIQQLDLQHKGKGCSLFSYVEFKELKEKDKTFLTTIITGESGKTEIMLKNSLPQSIKSKIILDLPDKWSATSKTREVTVPANGSVPYCFRITVPAQEDEGYKTIKVMAISSDISVEPPIVYVNVLKPLKIETELTKDFKITVSVKNQRSEVSQGTVRLSVPRGWKISPKEISYSSLAPGEEKHFAFRIDKFQGPYPSNKKDKIKVIATSNKASVNRELYSISEVEEPQEEKAGYSGEFVSLPPRIPETKSTIVYLSDLEPVKSYQEWGKLRRNKNLGDNPLTIANTVFEKGLGTHAHSEIIYRLDGRYNFLEGFAGLDRITFPMGSVVFQIYVDGKKLYDSGPLYQESGPNKFSISVKGAKQIRLVVTDAGDDNNSDHADWAEIKLTLKE